MYIDGDSHYWPLRFIDKVSHPGRGHVEVTKDTGDSIFVLVNEFQATSRRIIGMARKSTRLKKAAGAFHCAQSS
jgi:hypothetical protein